MKKAAPGPGSEKFEFRLTVHQLRPWPEKTGLLTIGWQRGKTKKGAVKAASAKRSSKPYALYEFNEIILLNSTLKRTPVASAQQFEKKFLLLAVLEMTTGAPSKNHGTVVINLADFANIAQGPRKLAFKVAVGKTISSALAEMGKPEPPSLVLTIECSYKGKLGPGSVASSGASAGSKLTSDLHSFFHLHPSGMTNEQVASLAGHHAAVPARGHQHTSSGKAAKAQTQPVKLSSGAPAATSTQPARSHSAKQPHPVAVRVKTNVDTKQPPPPIEAQPAPPPEAKEPPAPPFAPDAKFDEDGFLHDSDDDSEGATPKPEPKPSSKPIANPSPPPREPPVEPPPLPEPTPLAPSTNISDSSSKPPIASTGVHRSNTTKKTAAASVPPTSQEPESFARQAGRVSDWLNASEADEEVVQSTLASQKSLACQLDEVTPDMLKVAAGLSDSNGAGAHRNRDLRSVLTKRASGIKTGATDRTASNGKSEFPDIGSMYGRSSQEYKSGDLTSKGPRLQKHSSLNGAVRIHRPAGITATSTDKSVDALFTSTSTGDHSEMASDKARSRDSVIMKSPQKPAPPTPPVAEVSNLEEEQPLDPVVEAPAVEAKPAPPVEVEPAPEPAGVLAPPEPKNLRSTYEVKAAAEPATGGRWKKSTGPKRISQNGSSSEAVDKELTQLTDEISDANERNDLLQQELVQAAVLESSIYLRGMKPHSVLGQQRDVTHQTHAPARRLVRAITGLPQVKGVVLAQQILKSLHIVAVDSWSEDVSHAVLWWSNILQIRMYLNQLQSVHDHDRGESFWPADVMMAPLMDMERRIFANVENRLWVTVMAPMLERSGGRRASPADMQEEAMQRWVQALDVANDRLIHALRTVEGYSALFLPRMQEHLVRRIDWLFFRNILHPASYDTTPQEAPKRGPRGPLSPANGKSMRRPLTGGGSELPQFLLPFKNNGKVTFGTGMNLKMAIMHLQHWAHDHDLQDNLSPNGGTRLYPFLRSIADALMMRKELLLESATRENVCAALSLPSLLTLLERFEPDDFCPDPIDDRVMETLRLEAGLEADSEPLLPIYQSPTLEEIVTLNNEQLAEPGGRPVSRRRRNISLTEHEMQTGGDSDAELHELTATFTSDVLQPPKRFTMVRDLWNRSQDRRLE